MSGDAGGFDDPPILSATELTLTVSARRWGWAEAHRAEIDRHFLELQRQRPATWNGRVLLQCAWSCDGGAYRGEFLETDFASFNAWRAWGRPDAGVKDCFAAGAILCSDGGWLLGEMASHTVNAGLVYFPCGTPDPNDVIGARVDFEHSVARELKEETGLAIEALAAEPGWTVVNEKGRMAFIRVLRAAEPAAQLRGVVLGHLAREAQPELADIRIVRGPADLDARMPHFVPAFLSHRWSMPGDGGPPAVP